MKIDQFDKPTCLILGAAISDALQTVANEFGVSIKRKGGSYSSTNLTIKLEAAVIGVNGVVLSKEVENFQRYCKSYNLEPTDLGETVYIDGIRYKISGLSPRSRKFPVLAKSLKNGKTYKFPERTVRKALGRKVEKEIPPWTPLSSIDNCS